MTRAGLAPAFWPRGWLRLAGAARARAAYVMSEEDYLGKVHRLCVDRLRLPAAEEGAVTDPGAAGPAIRFLAGGRALLRREWGARPPWARWVLAGYLIGFADGTAAHLLAVLASLVVVDPLVVVLVALVRRAGIVLAGAVMAADLAANLTGNWAAIQRDPAGLLLSAGLAGIGLFGLFVLVTVVPLLRAGAAARARVS